MRIVLPSPRTLIARMDYGDVRGVQLKNYPRTGLRILSWYVEVADSGTWEKQILVLRPGETHPIIEMWKMAREKHGDRPQDDASDGEGLSTRVASRQPEDSRAPL